MDHPLFLILYDLETETDGMSSMESESLSSTSSESRDEHDATASDTTSQTGIGLSNPQLFQRERIMLDLINRMHNTGFDDYRVYLFNSVVDRPFIAFRSTWTYPRLPLSANRVLENPQSLRLFLGLPCLVHQEHALGTYWLISIISILRIY